ncbi:hypothetical protein SAMN05444161_3110 [Rhizobiales bacterium GAS191]|nr:hypothetical protein SAMN05444161_3110 [Rhizobiales bacterium GAS191]
MFVPNRMFVPTPKTKGAILVIMNTPQVAAAYYEYEQRTPGVIRILILDKISGLMTIFNNLTEVAAEGRYGKIDPEIKTEKCRRLD